MSAECSRVESAHMSIGIVRSSVLSVTSPASDDVIVNDDDDDGVPLVVLTAFMLEAAGLL